MNYSEKTIAALRHGNTNQHEIHKHAGFKSYQYFNLKVNNGTLELTDMEAIAHAIGAKLGVEYDFGNADVKTTNRTRTEKTVDAIEKAGKTCHDIFYDAGFTSEQYLGFKLDTDKLTLKDMDSIAHAIGANLRVQYEFEDGTVI